MKFVPIVMKLCGVVAILLLSGCTLPAPQAAKVVEPTINVREDALPKPTQTTWSTSEPTTPSAQPTQKVEVTPPASAIPSCDGMDPVISYRFARSGMKCEQVLALRNALRQSFAEDELDAALLKYHTRYCTEFGDQSKGEEMPYDPSKKSHGGEDLRYRIKPGESKVIEGETLEYDLGKFVPCRTPKQ